VQDVDLDVLREDAEGDVDRPGRASRVEQRAEDGIADLFDALFGERRLGEAAPDKVAYVRNRGGTGRENLR
jgi:hypothetical protein